MEYLGGLYGRQLAGSDFMEGIEAVLPVPLHPSRERSRGFNQGMIIARAVSEATGIELLSGVLIRRRRSETQTRRGRVERWENVSGIFEVADPSAIENRHLLLVDDVITTGSTVEACVNVLREVSGVRVSVVALAASMRGHLT